MASPLCGEDVQLASGGWPAGPSAGHVRDLSTLMLDSAIGPPAARGATRRGRTGTAAMRRRLAHGARETAHGVAGTAHGGGPSTSRWASWADWSGSGVEARLACLDLVVPHVSPSCHGDAEDPAGASRDRTEGLGDEIPNYDPSGGTGRFKSARADQN